MTEEIKKMIVKIGKESNKSDEEIGQLILTLETLSSDGTIPLEHLMTYVDQTTGQMKALDMRDGEKVMETIGQQAEIGIKQIMEGIKAGDCKSTNCTTCPYRETICGKFKKEE